MKSRAGYQVHAVRGFPEWGSFYQGSRTFSGWFASAAWNATSNWGLVFEVANAQHQTEFTRRDVTRDLGRRQASHRAHGGHPGAHRLQHARGRRRNPVPQGDGESETVCATRGRADELRKCRLPPASAATVHIPLYPKRMRAYAILGHSDGTEWTVRVVDDVAGGRRRCPPPGPSSGSTSGRFRWGHQRRNLASPFPGQRRLPDWLAIVDEP